MRARIGRVMRSHHQRTVMAWMKNNSFWKSGMQIREDQHESN